MGIIHNITTCVCTNVYIKEIWEINGHMRKLPCSSCLSNHRVFNTVLNIIECDSTLYVCRDDVKKMAAYITHTLMFCIILIVNSTNIVLVVYSTNIVVVVYSTNIVLVLYSTVLMGTIVLVGA